MYNLEELTIRRKTRRFLNLTTNYWRTCAIMFIKLKHIVYFNEFLKFNKIFTIKLLKVVLIILEKFKVYIVQ